MKKIALYIAAIMLFAQCSKEDNNARKEDNVEKEITSPKVRLKNGILVFKDYNALSQYLKKHYVLSPNELADAEEKMAFQSQKRIFDMVVDAESIHDKMMEEKYGHIKDKESLAMSPEILHSELYYKYIKLGVLREQEDTDGSSYMNYSVAFPDKAPVLNIDGLYAVKDTLYQITESICKVWYNANLTNPEKLLKTTETDSTMGIFVRELNNNGISAKSTLAPEYKKSNMITQGDHRGQVVLRYMAVLRNGAPEIHFSINARYEHKNWLGKWKFDRTGEMYIWAEWDFERYFYWNREGGSRILYPNPYYVPSANNLWVSVDPNTGAIGNSSNYSSYSYIVSGPYSPPANTGIQLGWGIRNFKIRAATPGGCCGFYHELDSPGYLYEGTLY